MYSRVFNYSSGGSAVGTTAPTDTSKIWVDTSDKNIAKYYDPTSKTWKPLVVLYQ